MSRSPFCMYDYGRFLVGVTLRAGYDFGVGVRDRIAVRVGVLLGMRVLVGVRVAVFVGVAVPL